MTDKSLGIIFRTPEYGKVKKRLASETGHEMALSIYKKMLFTTMQKALLLDNVEIYGFYDGRFPQDIALRYKKIILIPQRGKDLGEKLYNAASYLYEKGYRKIVLIGADSPDLPVEYIQEAFSRLDSSDVVIGPSEDGGYYLIGMKRPEDYLFKDIPWGSPEVLKRTISKIEKQEPSYFLLPEWYDIDDLERLRKWCPVKLQEETLTL
ncbi:MAG: TIGR04282 family arsenosugar biosynthesis glycosyltransferase [Thermodesulfovibrionales bacterium]